MSWYTYFKLKEDSRYNKVTLEECNKRIKGDTDNIFTRDYRSELLATMIQAYYEPSVQRKRDMIFTAFMMYITKCNTEYYYLKNILEDEKRVYVINHLSSNYESIVDEWDNTVKKVVSDLLILSTIRFEPVKDKNENGYSNKSATMSYLMNEYMDDIDVLLTYADDMADEYYRYKFLKEECVLIGDESDVISDELLNEKETANDIIEED